MQDAAALTEASMPRSRAVALWIAVTAVFYGLLWVLPMPGIDADAFGGTLDVGSLSTLPRPVSLVGGGVLYIIPLHLVLMLAGRLDRGSLRVSAAAVCLLVVALEALSHAFFLESMSSTFFADVVPSPGWSFRLTFLLSRLAAASVLLWVLGRVDRTGGAHGVLVFSVFHSLGGAVVGAFEASAAMVQQEVSPADALSVLVAPLCVFVVVSALLIRPPRWPMKVAGKVSLRSGWDLAGAVTLANLPVAMVGSAMLALAGSVSVGLAPLGALFQLLFTMALVFLVLRREGERGSRPWGLTAFTALSVLAAVALFLFGLFSSASGLERFLSGGPLEGEASFVLVLGAEGSFSPGDGDAMVERLEALGAEAELERQSADRITLAVTASDPQSAVALLQPRELAFRFAMNFPANPFEGEAELDPVVAHLPESTPSMQTRAWNTSCDVATRRLTSPPPGPCLFRLERGETEGECTLHCLVPELILGNDDIAAAEVAFDSYTNQPVVAIELVPSATDRFGEATAANVRSALIIEVDGEVVSAPTLTAPITEGRLQMNLGGYRSYDELLREAESVAGSLGEDGVSWGRFELLEVR